MTNHEPVLLNEAIEYLDPRPGENFIDCTLGNAGHTVEIAKRIGENGRVLGIDLDSEAIKLAELRIKNQELGDKVIIVQDNFRNLENIVEENKFGPVNGVLLDLGLSSMELQDAKRGFSFQIESPLDMRYGAGDLTALEILNTWPEKELVQIFSEYGEERYSKQIAREIVKSRKEQKIKTTFDLVNIIEKVYRGRQKPKIHFATKVFQALRIAVNDELENLKEALSAAVKILSPKGRLAVISFHSLEDRIVKDFFRAEARGCICPSEFPICTCGHTPRIKIATKKPITPTNNEINNNPRSRSAKMRVAIKI